MADTGSADLDLVAFMARVRARLDALSPAQLGVHLLQAARWLPEARRAEFVALIEASAEPVPAEPLPLVDLLEAITEYRGGLLGGRYGKCGARYTDDVAGPSDDAWMDDADMLLDGIAAARDAGEWVLARDAWRALIDAFERAVEDGLFSSDDMEVPWMVLGLDMDEVITQYLRCIYLAGPPEERLYAMRAVSRRWAYLGSARRPVTALTRGDEPPLPDWDTFVSAWIDETAAPLRAQPGPSTEVAAWLAAQAVTDFVAVVSDAEGPAGLARYARELGREHPALYHGWLDALVRAGNLEAACDAADEAVAATTGGHRALLADRLAGFCRRTGHYDRAVAADDMAWRSQPTLARLIRLADDAPRVGADRLTLLEGEHRALVAGEYQAEGEALWAIQLLGGEPEPPCAAVADAVRRGGFGSGGALPVVLPFLLLAATDGQTPASADCLGTLLDEADRSSRQAAAHRWYAGNLAHTPPEEVTPPEIGLATLYQERLQRHPLPPGTAERLLAAAETAVAAYVRSIVGSGDRGRYGRVAHLLAATVEVRYLRGEADQGQALLLGLQDAFSRHRAFQQELDARIEDSGLIPHELKRRKP